MSECTAPVPNPRKPKNGWRLANHQGDLHAINKKGTLWKIKHVFRRDGSSRPFIRVTSLPGCHLYNKERIRISCKRIPNKRVKTLFVSILKTKPFSNDLPEAVLEFFLEDGEFCEIVEDEHGYKQVFVKNLADVYVYESEDELLIKGQIYQMMVPKSIYDETRHEPHQALTLFNDGQHLYAICGEEKKFLSFKMYQKVSSSDSNSWMKFLGKEVMFKTFGHTLSGDVIVLLREKYNCWSVTFAIKRMQIAIVDELVTSIGIYFPK